MVDYKCINCGKKFKQKCHYIDHTIKKKKPCLKKNTSEYNTNIEPGIISENLIDSVTIKEDKKIHKCIKCNKIFSRYDSLKRHMDKYCKENIIIFDEVNIKDALVNLMIQNKTLTNEISQIKIKYNKLEEENVEIKKQMEALNKSNEIYLNENKIICNEINDCLAGNKVKEPFDKNKLVKWIKTILNNNKIELDTKLNEKDNIIKKSEKKITTLQDMFLKKQRRVRHPESNVIYMVTTQDHKKNRIYIIGKATTLHTRLSTYNKTCDHEVVYYKSCKNKEEMDLVEKMVLNKLDEYREKANRDRFILPADKNIDFFINIINKCIEF